MVVWGKKSGNYGSIIEWNGDKSKNIWDIHDRHSTRMLVNWGNQKKKDWNHRWPKIYAVAVATKKVTIEWKEDRHEKKLKKQR